MYYICVFYVTDLFVSMYVQKTDLDLTNDKVYCIRIM